MNMNQNRREGKLKILMLLLYYHPHSTGLTHYVKVVSEELVRRGHEVTVLAARHTPLTPLGESTFNGVKVIRLWAPIRISRGLVMPSYPWRIYQLLRRHDVVNIHIPLLETAIVAKLASLAGVKVVATHHGDLILPAGLLNRMIARVLFAFYQYLARRAACIIGYSDDYADNSYYLQPFRDKVLPIYPPIAIPAPQAERVRQLRCEWRSGDGPLIGFSGRFVQEKRPDLLIRALEVINRRHPSARIVFAGEYDIRYEGTWRRHRELVRQYRDQLLFLGLIRDKQELANFYAACDVLVLSSDSECFALVQVESMLCGTPVVMTDVPGGRVPVTVTGMGKLARAGDWRSIGETTLEVLENLASYTKPRAEIAELFSFDNTIDRYEALFRKYARRHEGDESD